MNFKVLHATYGTFDRSKDVTEAISLILSKKTFLKVSNDVFGDPAPNQLKYLKMKYRLNGEDHEIGVRENDIFNIDSLLIDENKESVLVAYYTNNAVDSKILNSSLDSLRSLKKTTNHYNVIVTTSVWESIPNNPFSEIVMPIKNCGSLNIVLQILDCLSFSIATGMKFKYLMMAEHDVMYPYNYLDSLSEIDNNPPVIVNQNCIGMCEKGFQDNNLNHNPLHQMVFNYDYAKRYFSNLLLEKMYHRFFTIEPDDNRDEWLQRYVSKPSVHINHSKNYTSHYDCYSKTLISDTNPYWGDFKKYYPENEISSINWNHA